MFGKSQLSYKAQRICYSGEKQREPPLLAAIAANAIYVALQNNTLFAVQTRTSNILWRSKTVGTIMDVTTVT